MMSCRPRSSPGKQVIDNRDPGDVELLGRRRRPPAGHTVGLFDERDADPLRAGGIRDGDQVSRGHTSAGAVAEHQGGSRFVRRAVEVDDRATVRGIDVEGCQEDIVAAPTRPTLSRRALRAAHPH